MHRFRKKSDAKRSEAPGSLLDTQDALPELPPTDDFRTSLILPDLSRRFSLLRSPTGEPVSLDHLKSKLANQRARGAETLITEEEEDMLLETLGRLRSKALQTPERSQEDVGEGEDSTKGSVSSSGTSSVTSSPSARSTKRYSNNLFGSGRLRDYTYLKNVASSKGSASSTRTVSLTPTEASTKNLTAGVRPVTPDNIRPPSVQSSPNEQAFIASAAAPYGDSQMQAITAAEYRLQESLGSSGFKRASTALETVMKELEDETEDEILVPRSVPVTRGSLDYPGPEARNSDASSASLVFEGGMAISIDQTIHDEFSDRRASPVPARTIPGYVPGMPRPMTPRDLDFDEVRSHSTTPRAQSPFTNPPASPTLPNLSTIKSRRESTSSTAKPSPTTPVAVAPLFLQRSTNGRFTPDEGLRSGDALEFDNPLNSSLLGRRRPASPLSGPAFQPLAVSSRPSSRPGTPSNVIWAPNPNNGHARSHSRNGSWTDNASSDFPGGQSKSGPWPRRSSALLDSPMQEAGQGAQQTFASAAAVNPPKDQSGSSDKPHAYIPEVELGSPLLASFNAPRSPTPTQNARRSPVSPVFPNFDLRNGGSRRTSKQNTSSPPHAGAFSTLSSLPLTNSSRSSLDSAGSSFHSWDEPDKVLNLFNDSKEQQPVAWHDFDTEKSNSVTPSGGSGDDEWDAEEIIMRYAGLRKADIAAIQEKLVTAAFTKIANTDPRDRAPSSLRRRRPSTSQSNYSRMASPPPHAQPPASPSPYTADDHYSSKASALLNSVVESIKDQPLSINTNSSGPAPVEDQPLTPNTRRNRDLARVLFGSEEGSKEASSDCTTTTTTIKQEAIQLKPEPVSVSTSNIIPSLPLSTSLPGPSRQPPSEEQKLSSSVTSPYLLARNPSTNKIPQSLQQQAELAREIQQKTEAATLALKKTPSKTNLNEGLKHSASISRKRIDTSQISTPRLVSASTSVDTIPLRSPSLSAGSGNGPSKLGSRFKKLRGSLRVKNVTSSGEETATPENTRTNVSQVASYDPAKLSVSGAPALSSATEAGRSKVPAPAPPSSAGPGLRGFMARFRNKQRMSEITNERAAAATSPTWPASPLTPRPAESRPSISSSIDRPVTPRTGQRPMYSRFPPANLSPIVPPAPAPAAPASASTTDLGASQSAAALEQLFAAANNLGLDQNALNDLLARSGSTSSRTLLSRTASTTATITKASGSGNVIAAQQISSISSGSSDKTATPTNYTGPSAAAQSVKGHAEDGKTVTASEESVSRKPTMRKADHLRKPKEDQTDPATAAIVRRTIIYANDSGLPANEFAAMVQRKNSARRRRVSAQSISARSVHDRVPTPPPSKSPAVKRFSSDTMPPMPQLPNGLGQGDNTLKTLSTSAEGHMEKSNSTYDSLFDMYGGESRTASMAILDPADQQKGDHTTAPDSGPALEVIELANGETIWNVVNGLRDTDDESIYTGRASFASEYSTREPGNDNIQLFVKEHTRAGSKGSTSSFVSRKKPQQGKVRPETKVFYSSSAQISRLIENLSQGMDAGSFNFLPNTNRPGHSASSSLSTNDINLTVEERLDRMLGAMNRT